MAAISLLLTNVLKGKNYKEEIFSSNNFQKYIFKVHKSPYYYSFTLNSLNLNKQLEPFTGLYINDIHNLKGFTKI